MNQQTPATKRILIIEDQILFGKAFGMILAVDPTIDIVGDAARADEEILRRTMPDIVLVDVDAIGLDIVAVAKVIYSVDPTIRICALSGHATPSAAARCQEAGVHAFIVKDISLHEFRRAIGIVVAEGTYIDPRIAAQAAMPKRVDRGSRLIDLSLREGEVVRYIVAGLGNREIASKLSLSEKTVKNHVSRIFSKFDCTARTQVAVQAIRTGLA